MKRATNLTALVGRAALVGRFPLTPALVVQTALAGLLASACDPANGDRDEPTAQSPVVNADLVPAPGPEAPPGSSSPEPTAKRETRAQPTAQPFELQRAPEATTKSVEEAASGPMFTLEAHWAVAGQAQPNFSGLQGEALDAARAKTTTQHVLDLLPTGEMRATLTGGAFSLQPETQLLGRAERTGWLVVWPGGNQYRALPSGSLLAVLREARADVAPLIAPRVDPGRALKERRFGFPLVRTLLTTNRGSLTLDQIEVPDAGKAGVSLCRSLLEMLAATPTGLPCDGSGIPVRARFEYTGATLDWIADSFKQRTEGFDAIDVPPLNATYFAQGLPAQSRALLNDDEVAALRKSERRGRVSVVNRDVVGAFLTLDGAAVAFVAPRSTLSVELPQGELRLGVRDFLGAELQPAAPLRLETKAAVAWVEKADAGAPKPAP